MSCDAIRSLFQNEGKHGGLATVEAVEMIADFVKTGECLLHPDIVEVRDSEILVWNAVFIYNKVFGRFFLHFLLMRILGSRIQRIKKLALRQWTLRISKKIKR
jgi:hypothetical protein